MQREAVERQLQEDYGEDGYLYPDYGGYCVANVPGSLFARLGADTADRLPSNAFRGIDGDVDVVLVCLIDGFGYRLWNRYEGEYDVLSTFDTDGSVTPLTSVYPSETAAAMTSIHTGAFPAEHHLLGWFQYLAEVDLTVASLPFMTADGTPATDRAPAADPGMLFAAEAIYQQGARDGVDSVVVHPADIANSGYTRLATAGAESVGYGSVEDLPGIVDDAMTGVDHPAYVFVYLPHVDAAGHEVGTEHEGFRAAADAALSGVDRIFHAIDPRVAERTMAVLTADHGLVDTVPSDNIDLNGIGSVWRHLRRDPAGEPIPPFGSARNVHFHLEPGGIGPVREALEPLDALVMTRAEATDRQLFGPTGYGEAFDRRCGDLIVSHRDRALWHREHERRFVSHHGGLNPAEMLVPFGVARLSRLSG